MVDSLYKSFFTKAGPPLDISIMEFFGILLVIFIVALTVILIYFEVIDPRIYKLKYRYKIWRYYDTKCPRCGYRTKYYQTINRPVHKYKAEYCACCGTKLIEREKNTNKKQHR